ncbi:unnamed protein product, partial [Musa acuminata subsp. burmannicoides]
MALLYHALAPWQTHVASVGPCEVKTYLFGDSFMETYNSLLPPVSTKEEAAKEATATAKKKEGGQVGDGDGRKEAVTTTKRTTAVKETERVAEEEGDGEAAAKETERE